MQRMAVGPVVARQLRASSEHPAMNAATGLAAGAALALPVELQRALPRSGVVDQFILLRQGK